MNRKPIMKLGAGILLGGTMPVAAEHTSDELETIVVVGVRASLATAQELKRKQLDIVDSVVAADVVKLPDFNITDALSRVTGVQITRDRGEGENIAIRGLTQTEATLNGREVFTAGTGRTFNFADLPAEMVASINVYKTSSAERIEGGIGGLVDLRTRRPFDFEAPQFVISARAIRGDLVDSWEPQFTTLLSDRWMTGAGEFGALLNASYQQRAWREDLKSTGNPTARTDLIAGETVVAPSGNSETLSLGQRDRLAGTVILAWRPRPSLEIYAEGSYAEFHTEQDSHQINVFAPAVSSSSAKFVPGTLVLFPGTQDLQSITWTNAPISILSFARDTVDRNKQAAIGGSWKRGALTLKGDLSYTESFNHLFFSGPSLNATAPSFAHGLAPRIPSTAVSGIDLLDPTNLTYSLIAYRTRPFVGELEAAQLDAEYVLDVSVLHSISAGYRVAKRHADNIPGLIFADARVTVPAVAAPEFIRANPYRLFPGEQAQSIDEFLSGDLGRARDGTDLRSAFGITTPIPVSASPLTLWHVDEETNAGYVMGRFRAFDRLDCNLGLKVVRTHEAVSGSQSVPSAGAGAVAPIDLSSRYTDVLPNLNVRYALADGLYLRAAASKTITRPTFEQLSPSLSLVPNTINPAQSSGSAGNPELKPIRARNLDLALERYFNASTSIYLTGFWKQIDGFVSTVSSPETYDGVTYQVSRPQNTDDGDLKGLEIGYQQFYDFLPGAWRGLGLQANYTYVNSNAPSPIVGRSAPLQGLSEHSYNIVGMYELGAWSLRLAYNWRDRFLNGFQNIVGVGTLPIYTEDYGWLDASVTYRFTDRIALAVEGSNLLNTVRSSYYDVTTRRQSQWLNDVQMSAIVSLRW